MTKPRFDIVVFNYKRVDSFLNNFNKITNFRKDVDRVTIISSSPSDDERNLVRAFGDSNQIKIDYLTRKNVGIDQYARIEYFLGKLGDGARHLNSRFIFQMQEHYLDTTSPHSIWGKELDYKIKGDVVPDNIIFDLDEIEDISQKRNVDTFFCDRNNACFFTVDTCNYIAPNGANFIFKTKLLSDPVVIKKIKFLKKTFENRYDWAVFTEFYWGEIFFAEGLVSYDYKRKRYFMEYKKEDFYVSPDDYTFLRKRFTNLYGKHIRTMLKPLKLLKACLRKISTANTTA